MVTASDTPTVSVDTEKSAPHGGATPQGRGAGPRFTIAAHKIMEATADLPDRERNALRWAHSYCVAKNLSHADLAAKLKQPNGDTYSKDSLYHAFTGGREPEQLKNMVAAIESLRRIEEERADLVDSGYIHNSIGKRIWRVCRRARLRQRIGFIVGDTQIGKTFTILEGYMKVPEHNHGQTKYFRFPAGGAYCDVLREMAIMLGLATGNNGIDLRRMIIDSFDEHMLLIADEIMESQSMTSGSVKRYLRTINFLREIHDRKKCGLVLIGTNVFRDALLYSKEARNLRQTIGRGLPFEQLPRSLGRADLNMFAKAFGLGPAPDEEISVRITVVDDDGEERQETVRKNPLALQTDVNRDFGLGRWKLMLQEASDLAREARRPITWGAVLKAWHSFEPVPAQGGAS